MSMILFLACATDPLTACPLWFTDLDGDGFGAGGGVASCEPLAGRVEQDGDCDDRDGLVNPEAVDVPLDGVDQDCDGEDRCESTRVVQSIEDVDCEKGMHTLGGDAYSWPEGDCVCEITGDLSLGKEDFALPNGNLTRVGGVLELNFLLEGEGEVFKNLMEVGSRLSLQAGGTHQLPRLRQVPRIDLSGGGGAWMSMPVLAQTEELLLNGGVALELERLSALQELQMLGPQEDVLSAPSLQSVDRLLLYGGSLDAPALSRANTATVQTQVALPGLVQLDTLTVDAGGQATLSHLEGVELVELAGELTAAKLAWLPRLNFEVGAQAELPALEVVDFLLVEAGELALPGLRTARFIRVEGGGHLSVPKLTSLDTLQVAQAAVSLPLLTELPYLLLEEQSPGDFDAPKLRTVGTLYLLSETLFPEITSVDTLEIHNTAELPKLAELGSLKAYDPIIATSLRDAGAVTLYGQGHSLPALRWVDTLRTQDCAAFGSLTRIDSWITSSCDLDLSGLNTFAGPLLLDPVGVATRFTLPDPLPTALWLDGSNYGVLDHQVIEGALSIQVRASAPAEDFLVRQVQGQLYLNLEKATGLGSLAQIEEVGGDVSYCMPLLSEAEIDAWLNTMSVGGEVVNRCP